MSSLLRPLENSNTLIKMGLIRKRSETNPTEVIRVLVMGSPSVGKTTLIDNYMQQKLVDDYKTAVSQQTDVPEDKIKLEIVETDGDRFSTGRRMAIRTAHAFLLVYAVDDEESFEFISELRTTIISMKGEDAPVVVVGNKVDCCARKVHPVVADCVVCMDWECKYVEVSTLEGAELDGVFSQLLSHPHLNKHYAKLRPTSRKLSLPDNSALAVSPTLQKSPILRRPLMSRLIQNVF